MSFQELFMTGINNLQSNDELRGAFNQLLGFQPNVDVVDTSDYLYVYIEIPGMVEDSISIDFFNNRLTVSGEKLKRYKAQSLRSEIVYGKFNRKIVLPYSVTNQKNVNVTYVDGILTLIVDKMSEEQNRFSVKINTKQ